MGSSIDEDAPTTEWGKRDRLHSETPLGGIELSALTRPGWDTQTFAVKLPVTPEDNRTAAMAIAALLSFVIGLGTFLLIAGFQDRVARDERARGATPTAAVSPALRPIVQEGVPVPTYGESGEPASTTIVEMQFVPTNDVQAPPAVNFPNGATLVAPAASPIVPGVSPGGISGARPARPATSTGAPTVRKGKKSR